MNYYEPLTYIVTSSEEGWLLRTVLRQKLGISRKLLSRLKLTEEGITVNGVRQYTNVTVKQGDVVRVSMAQERSTDILPQKLPLRILFEDDHLLIVDKPAGMIVHPTHGHYTDTLANAVVYHWRETGKQHRFRPVHRLDQETSGVLAVAKNPYAQQMIALQMQAGDVVKEYIAFVYGRPPAASGTVEGPIDRDPLEPHIRVVTPTGYPAVTHYRLEESFGAASRMRLRLETGRTHQIRVHMQHIGCPLIGDKLYRRLDGEAEQPSFEEFISRQALHASRLSFDHPVSGQRLDFIAELPEDMALLMNRLRMFASDNHRIKE